MSIPYAKANAANAQDEIKKILRRFGCSKIGFMDDHDTHTTTLYFEHQGRRVEMNASGAGWAAMYLKENPWTSRKQKSKQAYEQQALEQGVTATSSILRDWIKGQITAVECDVLKFDHVFAPYMVADNGKRMIDVIDDHMKRLTDERGA